MHAFQGIDWWCEASIPALPSLFQAWIVSVVSGEDHRDKMPMLLCFQCFGVKKVGQRRRSEVFRDASLRHKKQVTRETGTMRSGG